MFSLLLSALLLAGAPPTQAAQGEAPVAAKNGLDRATWIAALDQVERSLVRDYVLRETGRKTAAALRARRSELLRAPSKSAFAEQVQELLSSETHDVHLQFGISAAPTEVAASDVPETRAREQNDGFVRSEILPGNIAFLRIDEMAETAGGAGEKAVAAMRLASAAEAIIIDLRYNGGGSGHMGQLLSSYFFAEGDDRWLVSNVNRAAGTSKQEWTLPFAPGPHMPDIPLYFLLGPNTGSAAEGFAYNLRALGRARTVGAKSAGGAHSGDLLALPGGFQIFLPTGRTVNPVTGQNWERTGVPLDLPSDVQLAPAAALAEIWTNRGKSAAPGSPQAERASWYRSYYTALVDPHPLEDVAPLVGSYGEDRDVRSLDGHLYLARRGQPAQLLRPVGDGRYILEGADYYGPASSRWSFRRNGPGRITGLDQEIRTGPFEIRRFHHPKRSGQ